MIKIENLSFGYGKKSDNNEILHSVSAQIESGKITALIGPNGSGKSTLLKLIAGFNKAWNGTIEIDTEEQNLSKVIAYVPQVRQIPDVTVGRLVLSGRFPHTTFPHHYTKKDLQIAKNAIERMNISDLEEKELSELSGGQRQKAYIAMALAQESDILILDEPLTYLDIKQQLELAEILKSLREEGKTILLVIHDLNMALSIADDLIIMNDGNIEAQERPSRIATLGIIDKVFGIKTRRVGLENYSFALV